ncbi:DJ-1 family protein [Bacteroides coprosuis DSM 18011]|uniref:DJ-1 family protein n=2 Tax=Bacteroides TaxID=816 RepID=F3ZPK8_9BACE|nr:DJ-1 family protein [Bacteroides coprosuis DSM 18011]
MIYLFLADGFEEIEALTIVDVLRRANLQVKTVSVTDSLTVKGAHGISVISDALFGNCSFDKVKALVLPGGMPGAETLGKHKGLTELLKEYHNTDTVLAAICAAPMVFGQLGLLKGKKAVAYPGFEPKLEGASIQNDLVVVDGKIITGKGPAAALPFALKLAEVLASKETANQLRKDMCVE